MKNKLVLILFSLFFTLSSLADGAVLESFLNILSQKKYSSSIEDAGNNRKQVKVGKEKETFLEFEYGLSSTNEEVFYSLKLIRSEENFLDLFMELNRLLLSSVKGDLSISSKMEDALRSTFKELGRRDSVLNYVVFKDVSSFNSYLIDDPFYHVEVYIDSTSSIDKSLDFHIGEFQGMNSNPVKALGLQAKFDFFNRSFTLLDDHSSYYVVGDNLYRNKSDSTGVGTSIIRLLDDEAFYIQSLPQKSKEAELGIYYHQQKILLGESVNEDWHDMTYRILKSLNEKGFLGVEYLNLETRNLVKAKFKSSCSDLVRKVK